MANIPTAFKNAAMDTLYYYDTTDALSDSSHKVCKASCLYYQMIDSKMNCVNRCSGANKFRNEVPHNVFNNLESSSAQIKTCITDCPVGKWYFYQSTSAFDNQNEFECKANCDQDGSKLLADFYYEFEITESPTRQRYCVATCSSGISNFGTRACVDKCKNNAETSNNWRLSTHAHVTVATEEAKIYRNTSNNVCVSTCGSDFTTVQIDNGTSTLIDNFCSVTCPMTTHRDASFTLYEHYRLTYSDSGKKICSDSCPTDRKYFDYSTGTAPFQCVDKCSYTAGATRDLDTNILKEILITFKTGTPKLACVSSCVDTSSPDNVFATTLPNHKLVTLVDHLSADFVHYKCVDRCNKSGVTVLATENKTENTDYYWFNLDGKCVEECPVYTNNSTGENVCTNTCPHYVAKPVVNNR